MHRTFTTLSLSLILAACGGGGGDPAPEPRVIDGTFSALTGSVTPDPATTAQPLNARAQATFSGQFEPAASSLTIPCTVTVDGAAPAGVVCEMTFVRVSGQPGNGVHAGTLALTLPALRTAGTHEVCITLRPGDWGTWNGASVGEDCAPVVVTR